MKPRTQKAKGVLALRKTPHAQIGQAKMVKENIHLLPYEIPDKKSFPLFARPCPETPRHGFVESRKVSNHEELLTVLLEARQADPIAEVLTMPLLTGKYSGIATASNITWGLGHDGATAGKAPLWMIPCPPGKSPGNKKKQYTKIACPCGDPDCEMSSRHEEERSQASTFTEEVLSKVQMYSYGAKKRNYGVTTSAYVELVEHEGSVRVVQLRDGPELPIGVQDYVPTDTYRVRNVIEASPEETDLLAWEKLIHDAPVGSVIVMPKGSLSSHVAVHGVARGLAVITDPEWCDRIKAEFGPGGHPILVKPSGQAKELTRQDYKRLSHFVRKFSKMPYAPPSWGLVGNKENASNAKFTASEDVTTSISVLHAMMGWGPEDHLLRLRAFGAVGMLKYLTASCVGEARHFRHTGPGRKGKEPAVRWDKLGWPDPIETKPQREWVYVQCRLMSVPELTRLAGQAAKDFRGDWGGSGKNKDREVGFGGANWRKSALVAEGLGKALQAFLQKPDKRRWMSVVQQYNNGVFCAHNGGRLLDKFVDWKVIDVAARFPQFGLMGPRCAMICTTIGLEEALKPQAVVKKEYRKDTSGNPIIRIGQGLFPKPIVAKVKKRDKEWHRCHLACPDCFARNMRTIFQALVTAEYRYDPDVWKDMLANVGITASSLETGTGYAYKYGFLKQLKTFHKQIEPDLTKPKKPKQTKPKVTKPKKSPEETKAELKQLATELIQENLDNPETPLVVIDDKSAGTSGPLTFKVIDPSFDKDYT